MTTRIEDQLGFIFDNIVNSEYSNTDQGQFLSTKSRLQEEEIRPLILQWIDDWVAPSAAVVKTGREKGTAIPLEFVHKEDYSGDSDIDDGSEDSD